MRSTGARRISPRQTSTHKHVTGRGLTSANRTESGDFSGCVVPQPGPVGSDLIEPLGSESS